MGYRCILVVSVGFVAFLCFTIFEQVWSFVVNSNNPVSSISVINKHGLHDSATVVIGAFMMGPGEERYKLEFERYNVSRHCSCSKLRDGDSSPAAKCNRQDWTFYDIVVGATTVYTVETPLRYSNGDHVSLLCEHDPSESMVMTIIILPRDFNSYRKYLMELTNNERSDHFNDIFATHDTTWIHGNFYNRVLLSKTDFYHEHHYQNSQIDTTLMSAPNVNEGQTRLKIQWREGYVKRIDEFTQGTVLSFCVLMCTVLLGVERSYTIIARARERRKQERTTRPRKSFSSELVAFNASLIDHVIYNHCACTGREDAQDDGASKVLLV